jgi:hypothetical protein
VKFFHYGIEFVVAEFFYRSVTLGKHLAVASVGTENYVVAVERVGHSDGGRFLPGVKMRRPGVNVFHAVVLLGRPHRIEHSLELPDHLHVVEDAEKVGLGIVLRRLREGFLVRVERNVGEFNLAPRPHLCGFYELTFRHGTQPPL